MHGKFHKSMPFGGVRCEPFLS